MTHLCLLLAATMAITFGCQAPSAPAESSTPAVEVQEQKTAATKAKPSAVHEANAGQPQVHTNKGVPSGVMPNDSVHAPFRARGTQPSGMPAGHPPIGATKGADGGMNAKPNAEQGVAMPLPLKGSGSVDELDRRLKGIAKDQAAVIEEAFRLTFSVDRAKRNPGKAKTLLTPLLEGDHAATAHRILGYVAVSQGFDVAGAMKHYKAAAKLAPEYGEVHYALAFMYARDDLATGRIHFDTAMKLGVPDIRGIARFYPESAK